jgi:hypothetical protein
MIPGTITSCSKFNPPSSFATLSSGVEKNMSADHSC